MIAVLSELGRHSLEAIILPRILHDPKKYPSKSGLECTQKLPKSAWVVSLRNYAIWVLAIW